MGSVLSTSNGHGHDHQGQRDQRLEEKNVEIKMNLDKEGVEKLLECPICLEICIPPIFQCETGHHICKNCKNRLTQCPTCSAKFHGTRNFFLENYFEQTCSFSCQFSKDGCKEMVAGKDLMAHQGKCIFRPVPCPLCKNSITNLFSMSDYLAHLKNVHYATNLCSYTLSGKIIFNTFWRDILSHNSRNSSNGLWKPKLLKFHGFTFLVVNILQNFELSFYVSIFGDKNEANQFGVQLTIETKIENVLFLPKRIVQLVGLVIPIRCSEPQPDFKEYEKSKLMYNINLLRVCEILKPEPKFQLTFKLVKKNCNSVRDVGVMFIQDLLTKK